MTDPQAWLWPDGLEGSALWAHSSGISRRPEWVVPQFLQRALLDRSTTLQIKGRTFHTSSNLCNYQVSSILDGAALTLP